MVTRWRAGAFQTAEPDREMEPWARIRPDLHVWGAQWGPGRRSVVLEVARRDPLTGAPGDTDLWIATRRGDGWNPPRPLGAGVNTPGTEHFAFLAPDQCRLIFTRDRTGLHQVSLAAAIADTGPAPERWAATEPLQSIRPLVGSYRGAFVRNGSVQLVDAVITKSRDTLRLAISTPDRPFPFRPAVVASAGGRLRFPSPYGPVTAQVDSVFGEIIGSATRDGATTLLHLKRSPPAPTPSLAREEVTFPSSGGVTLAGTIVTPVGAPIVAGLVVVAGRSCGNRGFGLRLLDTFAQYGIAGIAIDKRGVGQSTGNCPFATIQQFSDDALAALDRVRAALPANTPIGFLGNSAGGWVSVHAAGRAATPIDFLITTVGPATSVKQQQLDATNQVAKRLGMSADQTARARRYIDLMFAPGATQAQYDEMKATVEWAKTIGFADAFFEPSDIPTSVAGIDSLWVRLNDYDPATDLGTLRIPILAFFGGADEVVPPAENVAALRRITSEAGNTRVRVVVVPSGDHGLFQEEADQPLGGTTYWRFGRVSPLVVEEVLGFLRRR
jgi:pimeloyl-ACP methyl ester carboxylesterase